MRRATEFSKFPQLPAELQLMIWEFTVPEPRVIRYSSRSYREYDKRYNTSIYRLEQTLPGILHACYDSRKEALKHYKVAFTVELCKPIYFDFGRDILEFGDFEALESFSKLNTKFNASTMEADRIRTLAITLEPRLHPHHFTLICSNFGKLEELKVREKDDDWRSEVSWWSGSTGSPGRWIPIEKPLKVIEREEITTYAPLMGLLATIRWNIEARIGRGSVVRWTPPKVVIGSKKSWEKALEKEGKGSGELDEMDVDEDNEK